MLPIALKMIQKAQEKRGIIVESVDVNQTCKMVRFKNVVYAQVQERSVSNTFETVAHGQWRDQIGLSITM